MESSVTPPGADDDGKADQAAAGTDEPDIKAEKQAEGAPAADDGAAPSVAAKTATAASMGALVPFVAVEPRQAAASGAQQHAKFDRLLGYGAHAALIVALVGFAWALSAYVIKGFTPNLEKPDAQAVALAKEHAERIELQHTSQAMAAEIHALKSNMDALRATAARAPTQDEIRGLEKTIDGLKVRLDTTKSETSAALAQVAGKIDHIQAEPNARLKEVAERLERLEREVAGPLTTGSIAPAVAPAAKTAAAASDAKEPAKRPELIANWVVRDVYDGIALVEGPHGMIEVIAGESIPGIGAVKSIEKRGNGWIVLTSRGMIEFARN